MLGSLWMSSDMLSLAIRTFRLGVRKQSGGLVPFAGNPSLLEVWSYPLLPALSTLCCRLSTSVQLSGFILTEATTML